MKAILISIRPQWCEKIASGKKTIEVRKSAPKEVPFKAYIYCTKSDRYLLDSDCDGSMFCWDKKSHHYPFKFEKDHEELFNGRVLGEFICDKIDTYNYHKGLTRFGGELGLPIGTYDSYLIFEDDYKAMCLSYDEVKDYGKGKPLYGLHISDLKIYDKPKELSEFFKPCSQSKNLDCDWLRNHNVCACSDKKPLTRPPQSYMLVEEVEE